MKEKVMYRKKIEDWMNWYWMSDHFFPCHPLQGIDTLLYCMGRGERD
jgi:hypothetical protein